MVANAPLVSVIFSVPRLPLTIKETVNSVFTDSSLKRFNKVTTPCKARKIFLVLCVSGSPLALFRDGEERAWEQGYLCVGWAQR